MTEGEALAAKVDAFLVERELWIAVRTEGATRADGDQQARELVEGLGERFVWGSNDPLPLLVEEGFRHVRSVSFDEACLSLTGTYRRERQFRFQRLVLCSVSPPARLAALSA